MQAVLDISTDSSEAKRWLFAELSAVLLASKSGELLNFNYSVLCFSREEVARELRELSSEWGFDTKLMCSCERAEKWLVYYSERVAKALREVPANIFHGDLAYNTTCPQNFIEELAGKWNSNKAIPHEVGFALGYPVKDVLGYMGLNSLPSSGCCGWCVYGDWHSSAQKNQEYQIAKTRALQLLYSKPAPFFEIETNSQRYSQLALATG